jgi:uncharacterized membrane protein YphA (DoxX/SURF4 family)
MQSNKSKRWFWIVTIVLCLLLLSSAIPSILMLDYSKEYFAKHLGYPLYFLPFTGVAKLLGMIAILIPGYPRVKEWAYAGFVFDLSGAIYSVMSIGEPPATWLMPFLVLCLVVISYSLYRKTRLKAQTEIASYSRNRS